jgi:ribonucleotide reductase alpha subunit
MYVIKRNGQQEPMRYDKITDRNVELSNGLSVDIAKLSQAVIQSLKNGMTTEEIDLLSAETAFYMSTYEPDFDILSSRIAVSNLHKTTSSSFIDIMAELVNCKLIREDLLDFAKEHQTDIQSSLDFSKDYEYNYFGFKTLEKAYLLKINNRIVERPQHMLMRVAITIHKGDISKVLESYKLMSQGLFTHASPTLFNAGMDKAQMSSCFLLKMDDDLRHIYETNLRSALISKHAGGIGIDISSVRSKGSIIKSTNGKSDGIVPMIKVFNATSVYCNQCFVPETIIYTKKGQKQIQNIKVGDEVITMDGTYKSVMNVIRNDFDDELLSINTLYSFEDVKVTKEHQIYTLQNQSRNISFETIRNNLNNGLVKPDFVSASDLTTNDMIGFPLPILPQNDIFDKLGNDFFRFYGIMLSSGNIFANKKEACLVLNDTTLLNTIIFIRSYLRNKNINFWETTVQNGIIIHWNNINGDIKYEDIYDNNKTKRIHEKYTYISRSHIIYLLRGLVEITQFTNLSYKLAHNIRYLLTSLGIMSLGNKKDESYNICVSKHPVLNEISDIRRPIIKRNSLYFIHNNIVWSRIKNITTSLHKGNTYDLSIIDNNNYVVASLGLVHNSGKRKGSFAMYLQPWHPDIFDFLALRLNIPPEEVRARDIFLAMWIPDLFMKRVQEDGMWSLICPSAETRLCDTYGEEFERIYEECERDKKYTRQVKAQEVWKAIMHSQEETGLPYILYKDAINRKNMQKNIGIIRSSNLCVHGDTHIITKEGQKMIKDLVGKEIEIWNGFEWTLVTPTCTGVTNKLLKVSFNNGSQVMMTEYHKVPLTTDESNTVMVDASTLTPGDTLTWWIMPDMLTTNKKLSRKLIIDVKVVNIEEINELHDTYCFTDLKRNLGVFNNVLLGNCAEIVQYTNGNSISVCNLASIGLPKFVETSQSSPPSLNWELLGKTTEHIIDNLNKIIDLNYYPVEEAKTNNLSYRPTGLGCQGLADVFALFNCTWGSQTARWLSRIISEVIYFHALSKSAELAEKEGPYSAFEGSPVQEGKLQYHLWKEELDDNNRMPWTSANHPMRSNIPNGLNIPVLDWESLINKCKKGVRNSLLICQMPTASSSQILGNNEALEPFTSNIYTRSVLSGDFVMVNKHLYKDLKPLGLWTKSIINQILEGDGSIQHITELPSSIRDKYKTVWEISQKIIIDLAAERGPFVDQTQSMNLFIDHPTHAKLSSMHLYGWKQGLKTGMYYLRSKTARSAVKFSVIKEQKKETLTSKEGNKKKFICTDDICTSCSA